MRKISDFTGIIIGKLKVIAKTKEKDKYGYFLYDCECECGKVVQRNARSIAQSIKKQTHASCPDCKNQRQSDLLVERHKLTGSKLQL